MPGHWKERVSRKHLSTGLSSFPWRKQCQHIYRAVCALQSASADLSLRYPFILFEIYWIVRACNVYQTGLFSFWTRVLKENLPAPLLAKNPIFFSMQVPDDTVPNSLLSTKNRTGRAKISRCLTSKSQIRYLSPGYSKWCDGWSITTVRFFLYRTGQGTRYPLLHVIYARLKYCF